MDRINDTERQASTTVIIFMKKLVFSSGGPKEIMKIIERGEKSIIDFLNAYSIFLYKENPRFRDSITNNYYIYPDGITVSLYYFLKKRKRLPRTPGPVMTELLMKQSFMKTKKHFFLGIEKEDVEVISENLKNIDIKKSENYNPPYIKGDTFSKEEVSKIIKLINKQRPDFLWVALGNPKKEILAKQIFSKANFKHLFLVGAALDFLSNKKDWAPSPIRKLGLEWLFRLLTDLKYMKRKVWGSFLSLFFMHKYIDFKE